MLTNEVRKQIVKSILDIISRIVNKEYQIRVWINGLGPECSSFGDTVNDFFQLCDPTLKEYKDFFLSQNQYEILKTFRDEFETFCDTPISNLLEEDLIETPEWEKIMCLAKEVLTVFNYKIK